MPEESRKYMPEIVFPSEWVKANVNVKQGDQIRFMDVGTFDPDKEQWVFTVEIYANGLITESKKFGLNKTNHKIVSGAYGTNSDGWVGKDFVINIIKVRNPIAGTMVDGIMLSIPEAKPAPVTPAQ